jgi:O-acetyl-ADP-ribose deacetylase (regulator of RNase III)
MTLAVNIGTSTLELMQGDITAQEADGIVNAANAELAGGGGVDGAIHRAGGPEIMAACRAIGTCPTGQAVATTAGALAARNVIHAVAPRYKDGSQREAGLLASAYGAALAIASHEGLKTVAFPSLGTGAYGYPLDDAARIALGTVIDFLGSHPEVERVRFVLFDDDTLQVYERVLMEEAPTRPPGSQ